MALANQCVDLEVAVTHVFIAHLVQTTATLFFQVSSVWHVFVTAPDWTLCPALQVSVQTEK